MEIGSKFFYEDEIWHVAMEDELYFFGVNWLFTGSELCIHNFSIASEDMPESN